AAEVELARVSVQHGRPRAAPYAPERPDPPERVEQVAAQKRRRRLCRPADPLVLVAPVLAAARLAREVEVEMGGTAGRTRRAGEHDAEHVGVLVAVDEGPKAEQLAHRLRREPVADVRARAAACRLPRPLV